MVAINTNIFQSQISVTTDNLSACGGSAVTKKNTKNPQKTHLPMQEIQELWV